MKYLLMVVLLFSFNQARAVGNYESGSGLLKNCEAWLNKTSVAMGNDCNGYVTGISDIYVTLVEWGNVKPAWCIPVGVDSDQLIRVVTKYLQENPEELHLTAGSLVANAFGRSFPCE